MGEGERRREREGREVMGQVEKRSGENTRETETRGDRDNEKRGAYGAGVAWFGETHWGKQGCILWGERQVGGNVEGERVEERDRHRENRKAR